MIRKTLMMIYAIGAYALGTASLLYLMGFIADVGVPKGISGGEFTSLWRAVVIDAGLVGLFGLHHSITARASFKRWWASFVPAPIERATYLYMTTIMTALLVTFWQPIPVTIWSLQSDTAIGVIRTAYLGVWTMMIAATFQFGHFSFFGLAQAWQSLRNAPQPPATMTARYLYALVRHPISVGWMIAPLLVPQLTIGHVVFAAATLAYVVIATRFEEADLIEDLGDSYRNYCERVPRFIPSPGSWRKHKVNSAK